MEDVLCKMRDLKIMRSFRLAPDKDRLLRAMAAKMGLNQTQVIEAALAWYNITEVKAIVDMSDCIYNDPAGPVRSAGGCIYDFDDLELLGAEMMLCD